MAVTQHLTSKFPGVAGALPVLPFPLYVNVETMTTAEDVTVPANAYFVVIAPDADVWIASGTGAAAVPSSDITNGAGSAFFKGGVISPPFAVNPGQILSIVSASGTAHVSLWYYAKLSAL